MARRKRGRRAHGEGSVFYRADRQRWMVRLPRVATLKSFETEKEALDHLITARQQQKDGHLPRASSYTVAGWLTEWLETRTARQGLAPASVMRYERSIKRITPILGTVKLMELEPRHVERLIKTLIEKKETRATVRMIFEDLGSALRSARKLKLITREATADVEPPKRLSATGAGCSLTDEEARELMAAAQKDEGIRLPVDARAEFGHETRRTARAALVSC